MIFNLKLQYALLHIEQFRFGMAVEIQGAAFLCRNRGTVHGKGTGQGAVYDIFQRETAAVKSVTGQQSV